MLSNEEIEFCLSLEKMFNYLKNKKELTEFEKLVIINFDFVTKKALSNECKTATEIVSKNMYYELIKRKEEYYEKQIEQLESDKQKLIEKLEKRRKQNNDRYGIAIDNDEFPEMYEYSGQVEEDDHILKILKGEHK